MKHDDTEQSVSFQHINKYNMVKQRNKLNYNDGIC